MIRALLLPLIASYTCAFSPPEGWEAAKPKSHSPHFQIGFVGKGSNEFCPSINLAKETINSTLKEYIKSVKGLHLIDKTTQFRDLGKFPMKAGKGHLTELTTESPFGPLTILQAFFLKENTVYILTAAVLKADFPKFQDQLIHSFQSLNLRESYE